MYRSRLPNEIVQYWQDDVEQNMEAGTAPVLELGSSNMVNDDIPAMIAIQRWCAQREDVTRPLLPVGGLGPLWLAAMLRPVPRYALPDAPEPVVVYAGANCAEYLLTVSMTNASADAAVSAKATHTAIPVSHYVTQSQPAMAVSWDALPFLGLDLRSRESLAGTTLNEEAESPSATKDPIQDWLAWAGLLLALFLVLLAVLL